MDQPLNISPPGTEPDAQPPAPDAPPPAPGGLLAHPLYQKYGEAGYLFLLFWCIYALSGALKATPYNAHVHLAKAFLEGRFYLDDLPDFMEHTVYLGHTYIAYGIAPSLLMAPFVAIWDLGFHQPMFSAALAALAVTLWWKVLGRLELLPAWRNWLTAMFGLGSLFWFYAGQNGNTWSIMHVVVCLGLLMAIDDCLGKQRAWVAGLGLALAVLSRQTVFLSLPFFVVMLWRDDRAEGGASIARKALLFAIGLGLPLLFNAYYNWARFGNPMDNGYARVIDEYQKLNHGFFHWQYLALNLKTYFWAVPERLGHFPWFNPTMGGFSIFLSTPALIFAFFADWKQKVNVLALIALLPILGFYLIYHWTGYAQFGCRYSLDFMPFALLLIASGVRNRWGSALSTCVAFGVLVELWGLFWWGIKEW